MKEDLLTLPFVGTKGRHDCKHELLDSSQPCSLDPMASASHIVRAQLQMSLGGDSTHNSLTLGERGVNIAVKMFVLCAADWVPLVPQYPTYGTRLHFC